MWQGMAHGMRRQPVGAAGLQVRVVGHLLEDKGVMEGANEADAQEGRTTAVLQPRWSEDSMETRFAGRGKSFY